MARSILPTGLWLLVLTGPLGLATAAQAGDGRLEISQEAIKASGGLPFVIDRPGTYLLTSDVIASSSATDILSIRASHVTIDLNGFRVGCDDELPAASCLSGDGDAIGVDDVFLRTGVHIENGTVFGMGGSGVALGASSSVERVRAFENWNGIQVRGGSRVKSVVANDNRQNGVSAGWPSTRISDAVAVGNANIGLYVGNGGQISDSVVEGGSHTGINGGVGATLLDNSVSNAGADGIECNNRCVIRGNTVRGAVGDGIDTSNGSLVEGNAISDCGGHGIRTTRGSLVRGNTLYSNGETGVYVAFGGAGLRENVVDVNDGGDTSSGPMGSPVDLGANLCGGDGSCSGTIQP